MAKLWLTTVTERSIAAQLDAAHRYRQWLDEIAADLPAGYVTLARDVTDTAVRWYEEMLAAAAPAGDVSSADVSTPPAELRLRGEHGGEATGSLVVENRHAEMARVSFLLSEFTASDGSAPFRPPLTFEPSRLTLQPDDEQTVEIRVPVDAAMFRPGVTYAATLLVRGVDEREVTLSVTVDPKSQGVE